VALFGTDEKGLMIRKRDGPDRPLWVFVGDEVVFHRAALLLARGGMIPDRGWTAVAAAHQSVRSPDRRREVFFFNKATTRGLSGEPPFW